MPPASPPLYHIYCDESRQTSERFMIIAGIRLRANGESAIKGMFDDYRDLYAMHAELKWGKVSPNKLAEYKRFLDYFLTLNTADQLHFKCMCWAATSLTIVVSMPGMPRSGFISSIINCCCIASGNPIARLQIQQDSLRSWTIELPDSAFENCVKS